MNTSQKLNKDLDKIGLWANKWKISFNPDPSKQSQVVIFFTGDNPSISIINSKVFGNTPWWRAYIQTYINKKINKANKGIGFIRKLNIILPCHALLTIYRPFVRPERTKKEILKTHVLLLQTNCNSKTIIICSIWYLKSEKMELTEPKNL